MDMLDHQIVSILLYHHEKHKPYYNVTMPLEAAAIIQDNLK
jgi:hypothetical protein